MKPEVKKWLIVGGLSIISVALAIGYLQYRKLKDYIIKVRGVNVKQITANIFDFDLLVSFTNNSNVKFTISEQLYDVYINDKFVTKIKGTQSVTILPKQSTIIPLNITFNPTGVLKMLEKSWVQMLLNPALITLKIDMQLKVNLYGFKKSMPITFTSTLKELLTKKPQ